VPPHRRALLPALLANEVRRDLSRLLQAARFLVANERTLMGMAGPGAPGPSAVTPALMARLIFPDGGAEAVNGGQEDSAAAAGAAATAIPQTAPAAALPPAEAEALRREIQALKRDSDSDPLDDDEEG